MADNASTFASDHIIDLATAVGQGRVGRLVVEGGHISPAYKQLKAHYFPKTDIVQRGDNGSILIFPTREDLEAAVRIGMYAIKNGYLDLGQVVRVTLADVA